MRSFHIDVLETLVPTNTCPSVSLRNRFPLVVVGGGVCEELIGFVCERDELSHWAHFFFFQHLPPQAHLFHLFHRLRDIFSPEQPAQKRSENKS